MIPRSVSTTVVPHPHLARLALAALVCGLVVLAPTSSHAQPRRNRTPAAAPAGDADAKKPHKPKVFDFSGIDLSGQNRSPQLLYFLERANEELERASLEKRSFIPEMVRSIEEDDL